MPCQDEKRNKILPYRPVGKEEISLFGGFVYLSAEDLSDGVIYHVDTFLNGLDDHKFLGSMDV